MGYFGVMNEDDGDDYTASEAAETMRFWKECDEKAKRTEQIMEISEKEILEIIEDCIAQRIKDGRIDPFNFTVSDTLKRHLSYKSPQFDEILKRITEEVEKTVTPILDAKRKEKKEKKIANTDPEVLRVLNAIFRMASEGDGLSLQVVKGLYDGSGYMDSIFKLIVNELALSMGYRKAHGVAYNVVKAYDEALMSDDIDYEAISNHLKQAK